MKETIAPHFDGATKHMVEDRTNRILPHLQTMRDVMKEVYSTKMQNKPSRTGFFRRVKDRVAEFFNL